MLSYCEVFSYLSAHNGERWAISEVLSHNINPEPSEGELGRGGEARIAGTHHCNGLSYHGDDDRSSTTPRLGTRARHIYIYSTELYNLLKGVTMYFSN